MLFILEFVFKTDFSNLGFKLSEFTFVDLIWLRLDWNEDNFSILS